ncbi:MAG: glucose 1-dehydrogenase [Verrucomicrobiota bacterium]|nr:glucose 1-dehydrogenase [Verrucomicrobiota bacterium]MED6299493.1 glucose 1-dehydrogenase [Verrucomicrobiota bacterium]MEE3175752.1 glucose 1-dehydrogenase [Verrucomicrobiota bacterium]
MFSIEGKKAFVSGASRGLGRQFANALANAGADVAVTSRTLSSLEGTNKEIETAGSKCVSLEMNVLNLESIQDAVNKAEQELGEIDILINNAGCNIRKPALEVSWEDWNTVVDTNLKGAFFLAQAIAKGMTQRNYGRIVNIGSVTCVAGYAGLAPYGASRGGIKQMTMSLAHDWGDKGVTVNCLAPGWFKTEQNAKLFEDRNWVDYIEEKIPLGRIGKPNDLDGTCLFLASDASAYVTGQTILVDGGISVGAVRAMPAST